VWLDGQEVTQFTYFQAVGGAPLDVPAVEITYGLERIVTALQGVSHFTEMRYSPGSSEGGRGRGSGEGEKARTSTSSSPSSSQHSPSSSWPGLSYGEMLLQNEYEWSVFNLDAADVPMQRAAFDLHKKEAERLLEARLPLPAYGQILKMSHAFNVLDARGAVSVSDRASSFADMRNMARKVSALWLARRGELGWPLLRGEAKEAALSKAAAEAEAASEGGDKKKSKKKKEAPAAASVAAVVAPPANRSLPSAAADFFLEIGCEELPPDDADAAREQLHSKLEQLLSKLGLCCSSDGESETGRESSQQQLSVEATPRRIVARVRNLPAATRVSQERLRGPPAKAAFENNGEDRSKPTRALLGFCSKNGVDVSAVEVGPEEGSGSGNGKGGGGGVDYCWASVTSGGEPAAEALEKALPALLAQISFGRSMRWEAGGPTFSRPVRWLAAMHGAAPLAFAALGASSLSTRDDSSSAVSTKGIRDGIEAPWLPLADASSYDSAMASQGVILSSSERENAVRSGAEAAAHEAGGRLPGGGGGDSSSSSSSLVEGLVKEVARLVEAPFPLLGSFDPKFLDLPRDVLVTVMRKHQRYFPVEETGGSEGGSGGDGSEGSSRKLLPAFVLVANGNSVDPATVVAGNEAVLRARFEDARFFYSADCAKKLSEFVPELENVAFHRELGSLLEKQSRVGKLLPALSDKIKTSTFAFSESDLATAAKASALARADAATSVVREMTSLAGVMGRHYALRSGEEPAVAEAIFESALPRSSGDLLPKTPAGALLAVADRIDSIVGLWSVGGAPTASADPYGLRRAALGLLETAISTGMRLDVARAARESSKLQPVEVTDESLAGATQFVARRLEQLLIDRGLPVEAVRGALGSGRSNDPALAAKTAEELAAALEESLSSSSSSSSSPLRVAIEALSRPARITRSAEMPPASLAVDESLFDCDEERALAAALKATKQQLLGSDASSLSSVSVGNFLAAVGQHLPGPVAAFFDSVFVMCEDPKVKNNRLALLREVAGLSEGVVKFDELPGF
jgi:glycyl-tRNA synthetase